MELTYVIGEQDFIDYNLYFVDHDPHTRRVIARLRWQLAILVLIGGSLLMYLMKSLTTLSAVVYGVFAVAAFFYAPQYFRNRVKKNVHLTIKNAANKHICGPKTMRLSAEELTLEGENEKSSYQYSAIHKVVAEKKQIFVMLDDMAALIVPNSAFENEVHKNTFLNYIGERLALNTTEKSTEEEI